MSEGLSKLFTTEGGMLVRDGLLFEPERSTMFAHHNCYLTPPLSARNSQLKWMVNDDCPVVSGVCVLCGQPFQIKGRVNPDAAFQEHYL